MIKNQHIRLIIIMIAVVLLSGACESSSDKPKEQPAPPATGQTPANSTPRSDVFEINKLERIRVGHKIPEFTVNDFTGKPTTIASRKDPQGELIVIYSPSCNVCHATMPRWIELYRQFFLPQNIPFIGLSVENSVQTAISIREMNIPFKVVVMPDIDLKFGYRVPDIPMTLAVGPDGNIINIWNGNLNENQLLEVIKIFCPQCNVTVNKS
jgi:peroxiredoxin